jgi:hypothetical protein
MAITIYKSIVPFYSTIFADFKLGWREVAIYCGELVWGAIYYLGYFLLLSKFISYLLQPLQFHLSRFCWEELAIFTNGYF